MSGADTPSSLAAAERDVADARDALDNARDIYDAAADDVMAAVDNPRSATAECVRACLNIARDLVDLARDRYNLAFDALAAVRFAASPLRLMPRALTPDEAAALDLASYHVAVARRERDSVIRSLWESQILLLEALAEGSASATDDWRSMSRDLVGGVDDWSADLSVALGVRAPLLAAQWEAAS